MPDSTFPSDRPGSPEQNGDSSTDDTLGRNLLRRYGHAGVLRRTAMRGVARRCQAIGAQTTSVTRAIQRRWFPAATGYGQSPSELVFRQGAPADLSQPSVAQGRPLQPLLQQTVPEQEGLEAAPVRTVRAIPVESAPDAADAQRRTVVPLHRSSQVQAEPATSTTAAAGLPVVARRQEPRFHPSVQRAVVQSMGGQPRRSSTRSAAMAEFGAVTVRGLEVASARHPKLSRSELGVQNAVPIGLTVVAARRSHPSATPGAGQVPTLQVAPSAGFGAATIRGEEIAPAHQVMMRRSEPERPSAASTSTTVVAARRPHLIRITGGEQPADASVRPLAQRNLARQIAPVSRPARTEDPQVSGISRNPVVASTWPGVVTSLSRAEIARGTLPYGTAKPARMIVVPAQVSHEPVMRSVPSLTEPISHMSTQSDGWLGGGAGALALVTALEATAPHSEPFGAVTSQVTNQAQRRAAGTPMDENSSTSRGVWHTPRTPELVRVVSRQPPRRPAGAPRDENSGARSETGPSGGRWLFSKQASDPPAGTRMDENSSTSRGVRHTPRTPELIRVVSGQSDLQMAVQRVGGSPALSREFDVVRPAQLRSQEAAAGALPLARRSASITGGTHQDFAQRRPDTPGSTIPAAVEATSASPIATKGTSASSANGAGRNSLLDEANIEQLADRVIGIIERRITIEAESRGLSM